MSPAAHKAYHVEVAGMGEYVVQDYLGGVLPIVFTIQDHADDLAAALNLARDHRLGLSIEANVR